MRNLATWQPTKFVYKNNELVASSDTRYVACASRLMATQVAKAYDSALKSHASGRLLDLGCGNVPLYAAYSKNTTEVVCADWINSAHTLSHVDLYCDVSRPLPIASFSFDTVILSDVLEHVPEPHTLLNEVSRILRPGGKLILSVPFFYWIHERPYDYFRYTRYALQRMLEQSKLQTISLDTLGGSDHVVADLLAKHSQFIPLIGKILAVAFQSIPTFLALTRAGRKLSQETSEAFPYGYFLIAQKR